MNITHPTQMTRPVSLAGFCALAVPDMIRLTSYVGNAEINVFLDARQSNMLADVLTRRDGTPFVGAKEIKMYRLREVVQ